MNSDKEWEADMQQFTQPGTLLSVEILHPVDFLSCEMESMPCLAVESWFVERRHAKVSLLCMTCNHEWKQRDASDKPASFVIVFNAADNIATVSALCEACDKHKERDMRCLAVVKQAFGEYDICAKGTRTLQ